MTLELILKASFSPKARRRRSERFSTKERSEPQQRHVRETRLKRKKNIVVGEGVASSRNAFQALDTRPDEEVDGRHFKAVGVESV